MLKMIELWNFADIKPPILEKTIGKFLLMNYFRVDVLKQKMFCKIIISSTLIFV